MNILDDLDRIIKKVITRKKHLMNLKNKNSTKK
jgi:hypothetical protein